VDTVRGLLVAGNGKLGMSIWHFDLPARTTCPGATSVCRRECYAARGRFRFGPVRERLRANLAASRRADFADRVGREIRRKGVLVVRVHVAGDFYSPAYTRKWLAVFRSAERTRFYFYTRSYRVPAILPVLGEMVALPNVRVWFSTDAETGMPVSVPPGVRLAHLDAGEPSPAEREADLVFRVKRERGRPARVPLAVVCPHEVPRAAADAENCGHCQVCFS
jgi:hypothetical protein